MDRVTFEVLLFQILFCQLSCLLGLIFGQNTLVFFLGFRAAASAAALAAALAAAFATRFSARAFDFADRATRPTEKIAVSTGGTSCFSRWEQQLQPKCNGLRNTG